MPKKGKNSAKSSRPTALITLVLILVATNAVTLYYFVFLDDSVPASEVPLGFDDITGPGSSALIGRVVTVVGYYVYAAGYHMIVSNPIFFFNNSLSSDNHLVVSGQIPDGLNETAGKMIAITGTLQVFDPDDGTRGLYDADSYFDVMISIKMRGVFIDVQYGPYEQFAEIPQIYDPVPEKYAVLYSGGIKPEKAYSRYWNDIIYMYFILQMHGYKSENIYVVYKDGVGNDQYTPVSYPATHNSMDTVFGILSQEMGLRDTLFFYTTNHGGSGGISVWGPMDSSGALTHSQVANWLDSITCNNMIIVMEQCVSGKFIQYISGPDRVIMTACTDSEGSYSCDTEGNWDEFVYHFMCALVSYPWNGDDVTVDADFNDDGLISMREAFIWAGAMDSRSETPWYNDNGNGYGYNALQVYAGSGPWYGDGVFL
ncbi:MAG: C13 family peptidase [Candidatus Thorarchaeota archaeon]